MFSNLINYMVGGKSDGKALPVDVRLSLDADFKRTLIKSVSIAAIGIGAGIAAGIAISEANKRRIR